MSNLRRGKTIFSFVLIILLNAIAVMGCKNYQANLIVPPPCNLPDTISFKNDIEPVFEISCDQPLCHSGTQSKGRVNLEPNFAYANLFKNKLIDTLNPVQSQLYQRLTSKNSSMPPGIYLDNCTIQTILIWIEQGARNN